VGLKSSEGWQKAALLMNTAADSGLSDCKPGLVARLPAESDEDLCTNFLVHVDKVERAVMATMTSLSPPLELSRQFEWCSLFLAHLNDFATLAWYLVADGKLVECIVMNTLKSLESIPFDASQPRLTYNQARDMLITQGIAALNLEHRGPRSADQSPGGELLDLPRLAFRVGQRLLFSADTECYDA
jgi:hypothetical protein